MEKTIVVPIDFSEASFNAYRYATKMAQVIGTKLELLHINESPFPELEEADTSHQDEELKKHLLTFSRTSPQQQCGNTLVGVQVEVVIKAGDATQILLDYSKKQSTSMIVMGATGSHAAVNRLMGNVAESLSQRGSCPVMLIPRSVPATLFEHILYVSDYESADETVINQMLWFSRKFFADLNFIHVDESNEPKDYRQIKRHLFQKLPYTSRKPSFNIGSTTNDSLLAGIAEYGQSKGIDCIVLVNQERSYLESILKKSLTQQIVKHLDLPVLVYHQTSERFVCQTGFASMLN